ncbi:hypothetical protein R8Z50_22470 [Longispora sp. K20-0274]|uniref:hypothetical protein n=1 Tax=Longispora sp. K20-0274 TaxID=3088255 RepID=UPI00399B008D
MAVEDGVPAGPAALVETHVVSVVAPQAPGEERGGSMGVGADGCLPVVEVVLVAAVEGRAGCGEPVQEVDDDPRDLADAAGLSFGDASGLLAQAAQEVPGGVGAQDPP